MTPELPESLQRGGRWLAGRVQDLVYRNAFDVGVRGRGRIPHDRNVLVVANHASHLDTGLVQHALGNYGRDLVTLAAHDYFFDSPMKRALFRNFTNLLPVEREGSDLASLEEARQALLDGRIVLLFPEGTRSPDGRMRAFKPGVGYLVLETGVDVLPLYLEGTHQVLPKGSFVPRKGKIVAHIGAPIPFSQLEGLVGEERGASAYRAVSKALEEAVVSLRPPGTDLRERVRQAFLDELPARFRRDGLRREVSFYFVLGDGREDRWTVRASPSGCRIDPGKRVEQADCVLKSTPETFLELVEDGKTPPVSAFVAGDVKTNDPALLEEFRRIFRL